MNNSYNTLLTIVLAGTLMFFSSIAGFCNEDITLPWDAPYDAFMEQDEHAGKLVLEWPRQNNPIHMVVIFTKFKGEAPGDTLVPSWAKYMFDGKPGSIPHYFDQISLGQIKVTGEYLPKLYEMPRPSDFYVKRIVTYTKDIIKLLDKDKSVDFSNFDNDGPDGIPGSEDDDEYVDYIVLMPISHPYDFIVRSADGVGFLRLYETFYTRNKNSLNRFIKIDKFSGCIASAPNLNQALGLICHEYSHSFGLPDLYDGHFKDNESDSAGIGFWGIMGHGILGWYGTGGPSAPCAYTRMLMGCIGINNSNLVDIYGVHRDIRISDVGLENGKVYRIWIDEWEYFLIEYRRNDGIYYDRKIPNNGLLIWHILERENSNRTEEIKLCDLESPDGRYKDAGFPVGETPKSNTGGDNLDFWSHNSWYTSQYAGNLGDATDVYDGVKYTRFTPFTNPNTSTKIKNNFTKIEIFNIHPEGNEMVFDVNTPPFTDWSKVKYPFIGMALQRFNITFEASDGSPEKTNTLYLINYGQSRNAEELITVFNDSLTVDNLTSLSYYEIQKAIEKRAFTNESYQSNLKITRENISTIAFQDELMDLGVSHQELSSGKTPGWVQKISLVSNDQSLPEVIRLNQNYPNPFNALTTIAYYLPTGMSVTLEVFNILGQRVITMDRGFEGAGSHTIQLNAGGLSSGIYLYRIQGNTFSRTRKFLLIR
ncbi:MAG TPA: T9SS type A sorting domain-containing protein [bacterium]|nr:T9SS type A sorting domain-containing protein [bacterium]